MLNVSSEMSTISQWAVYQMCRTLDNNYTYILKIVKDVYPELYSKSPDYDWQRKSILGYFHKSFAKFLQLKDQKKIEKEKWKPFQWSKWNKSTNKKTVIDLTHQVPTNWNVYNMYQLTNGNCSWVLDQIRNEYPNFIIPENFSEDNLKDEIFINYEKIQTILDDGGEKELNEEKETPFSWQLIELRPGICSPYSIQCLMPNVEKSIDAVHVRGDKNGQQISRKHSKDQSKCSHSYDELIVQAISSTPDKQLTLNDIYIYITQHYPQYKAINRTWKKLVKDRLYLSSQFVKVHNSQMKTDKGCLWRIPSVSENKPASRTLKRTSKEPIPCSTTPNDGSSISAAKSCPKSSDSNQCLVPDVNESVDVAHVEGDNNDQQISRKHSKDQSKSSHSYNELIIQAISSTPDKQLTLNDIYIYITQHYPQYKAINRSWKELVRRKLYTSGQFVKVDNSRGWHGKGYLWEIVSVSESNPKSRTLKKSRQKAVLCSTTPSDGCSIRSENSCLNGPGSSQCLVPDLEKTVDAAHVDLREPVDVVHVEGDNNDQQISRKHSKDQSKSSHSCNELIVQAISSTPDKQLTLNDIYIYITQHYPQYKRINRTWKKLVKRKLYSSGQFVKVPNSQSGHSKAYLWEIVSVSESNPASRTLKGSCQNTVPCSTTPNDECSIELFAEPNSIEMQDDVAVYENLTDHVSVDNCLSISPPPPPASLHLNPNILPVSQVQTPPPTGTPPPPFRPSTEVSRGPLEETAASTSLPSSIDMLAGGSDDSECQNLILSIKEFESLISNGMREIDEKDAKIESLKQQINTVSINQSKMCRNLKRLQNKHQRKKINFH